MACYSPNLMRAKVDPETGCIKYTFEGKAKLTDPRTYGDIDKLMTDGSYSFIVPCGKCTGCAIDYSREWASRMVIELMDNDKAIFCTLTYNNDHLPKSDFGDPTLSVRDCQLFMKRLRKYFGGRKIRFYLAGEYGSKTFRPHYHAILYGIGLDDFPDLRMFGYNELKDPYYTSDIFASIWKNGFVMLSSVNYKTCAYVARYVTKKHYRSDDCFAGEGILPEFSLCSRRPGIGLSHAADFIDSGHLMFPVTTSDGVHQISLPKSFIRHMKKDENYVEKCGILSYNRSKDAYARLISNLEMTQKSFDEYLSYKEKNLTSKLKLLPDRNGGFNEETSEN